MNPNLEPLRQLVEKLKNVSFFERIFKWNYFKNNLLLIFSEFEKISQNIFFHQEKVQELTSEKIILSNNMTNLQNSFNDEHDELILLRNKFNDLNNKVNELNVSVNQYEGQLREKNNEISRLNSSITKYEQSNSLLNNNNTSLREENIRLVSEEEERKRFHDQTMSTFNTLTEKITLEREKEKEILNQKEIDRINGLKEKWLNHQLNVKNTIKNICHRNIIEYIDKVPFKFEPDNTIQIAQEYHIFDAKSPGTDDLKNFPNYLRDQADKAKKYSNQDGVNSTLYFVVPTNTLESLDTYIYKHGDHDVVIISLDGLESVIMNLKKIETYEFVDKLSIQERDSICRIIGKWAHYSKRKIQIDNFFAEIFIELIKKTERELPEDIISNVKDYEKKEKVNPPLEKRTKSISSKDLIKSKEKMNKDLEHEGISIEMDIISTSISEIPLYLTSDDK
jgi:hypothetical protein